MARIVRKNSSIWFGRLSICLVRKSLCLCNLLGEARGTNKKTPPKHIPFQHNRTDRGAVFASGFYANGTFFCCYFYSHCTSLAAELMKDFVPVGPMLVAGSFGMA